MKKKRVLQTPKPVHPISVQHHGLFGTSFVKHHMLKDEHFTLDSLTEEYKKMIACLEKHSQLNKKDQRMENKQVHITFHNLKKQCRDGRTRLKLLKSGNPEKLRSLLKDHTLMKRLYQKMPVHLVSDNIHQRTFVLRKERDRLENRMEQLKDVYEKKLQEKADLENRLKFQNIFKEKEESFIDSLKRKAENSKTRIKAIIAVNSTYKKIIQILNHDAIFYEPILRSLDQDIEDQSKFIKHILYLGSPALVKFKELSEQYRLMDDKVRKSARMSHIDRVNFSKSIQTKAYTPSETKRLKAGDISKKVRSYVKETKSMQELRTKFEEVEKTIKKIQMAIVCAQERSIYSRIKSQMKNTLDLNKKIEGDMWKHLLQETKFKWASLLKGVLYNNLGPDGLAALDLVNNLKLAIKKEDTFEEETIAHMKRNSDLFVLLRFFLWNLFDIMRHVGPRIISKIEYPVDYLKLPLLTFERFTSRVVHPLPFVENVDTLLQIVTNKLKALVKAINVDMPPKHIQILSDLYCHELIKRMDDDMNSVLDLPMGRMSLDVMEVKIHQKILTREQIKMDSARLVEKNLKKD